MDITKSFISDTKIDSVDRISLPFRARTLNELNDWKLALYREKQIIIVSKKSHQSGRYCCLRKEMSLSVAKA